MHREPCTHPSGRRSDFRRFHLPWHKPNQEPPMRRDLCRDGKATQQAASIRDSFNSLLTADEESSRSSHDLRRHGLQIVFPHEPKWDAVAEFRVQASQPGLDYGGIFLFGEHPDQLEGEPQTLFGITVKLTSVHPPIDGAHIPDTSDIGGELAANEADELLDDLRDGEAERFTMRRKIRTRCGNGCQWEPPANRNIHRFTSKKQLNYT